MFPEKLKKKLTNRKAANSLRTLVGSNDLIDFSSNDYLGLSTSKKVFYGASEILKNYNLEVNGATGSRLLSGNHDLFAATEDFIASFHQVESALIFNSGYDANLGFFSSVPQRGDVIFYDELCHASIRDGILMSNAKSYKYKHNDVSSLKQRCAAMKEQQSIATVYVVTESVFSMDGDMPNLIEMSRFCKEQGYLLVVDEAHAVGIFGDNGRGMVQQLRIEEEVFAQIVTFGKALGCHGAAVLGSKNLKSYLINFAKSLVYTTALPPPAVATILSAYSWLQSDETLRNKLHHNIAILQDNISLNKLDDFFILSKSAIQCCVIPGNNTVKNISAKLKREGFDVKPILSPTVPQGQERLRLCLHSYNREEEISTLLRHLASIKNQTLSCKQ